MSTETREGYNPDGTPIWSEQTLRKLIASATKLRYWGDVHFFSTLLREQYGVYY